MTPDDLVAVNAITGAVGILCLAAFAVGLWSGFSIGMKVEDWIEASAARAALRRERRQRRLARQAVAKVHEA